MIRDSGLLFWATLYMLGMHKRWTAVHCMVD